MLRCVKSESEAALDQSCKSTCEPLPMQRKNIGGNLAPLVHKAKLPACELSTVAGTRDEPKSPERVSPSHSASRLLQTRPPASLVCERVEVQVFKDSAIVISAAGIAPTEKLGMGSTKEM